MKLNHPNIVNMFDYGFDSKTSTTYIVLEYAENGTLFDYFREFGMKDKCMMRGVYNSVCDAIQYLHSMNIMHRDIKVFLFLFPARKHFVGQEKQRQIVWFWICDELWAPSHPLWNRGVHGARNDSEEALQP